ncbi:uncharacterized protein LOC129617771, partial [Condylostylus longicornis]|uniref:uncharacterized protein LOC129617771 n=1 Tax=Condylostylus longicornis TaxID=2530218 RepID=UPI00244E51F2
MASFMRLRREDVSGTPDCWAETIRRAIMPSGEMSNGGAKERDNAILLFDLDGTLTPSRLPIESDMIEVLKELKEHMAIGIVSGSNEGKMREQLKPAGDIYSVVDYLFPENGSIARYRGEVLGEDLSLLNYLGEQNIQALINFALRYIADLDLPKKRGTFIEFRT